MRIFRITVVITLLSLVFASISHAASERRLVLKDGESLTINKVFFKKGAKLPPPGAISINTIQKTWDRLSKSSGFDAFVMYDSDEEVNAYIARIDRNDFLVVIQLGLLKVLKTEDEIAGVLAHEIGHGVKRHADKKQGNTTMLGANVLSAVLKGGFLKDLALKTGTNLAMSGYSRENEIEADNLGVEYAAKAGFNPWGLYNAIDRMAKAGLVTPPSGFNSHPPTERRMTNLKNQAEKWGKHYIASRVHQRDSAFREENSIANRSEKADVITTYPLNEGRKNVLTVLHNRAMALYNSGKYDEALPLFIRAVDSYDGNYLAAYWAARSAQNLNNRRETRKWIDKSLEINPNYFPAKQFKTRYY
jgi:putative metalloprotease